MRQLFAALGSDIKEAGRDKWTAKCPVHKDKDFAMSVKLNDDNSVMAYCFACGANGLALYRELGLNLDELFGGKKKDSGYIPGPVMEQYTQDIMVVGIYEGSNSVNYNLKDKRRYRLAVARIEGLKQKYKL